MATTLDTYTTTAVPNGGEPSVVYVSDAAAEAADTGLAELTRREAELGARRNSPRGEHPDVDTLYDELNAKIGEVKTEIARRVLAALNGGSVNLHRDTLGGLRFDRHAGCGLCPCSPGVVAPGLRMGLSTVAVSVELA